MISLKQLTYALAVQDTRHFKQAAERCFVSQSTLSSAIAELEAQLGVQLFERDNKKVLITSIGEQILSRAQNVLTQIHDIEQLAKSQSEPLSQPMRLGVIPTIGPYLLPKVLPTLREQYSGFALSLAEEQSAVLVDQVRRGVLDTAIIALPYPVAGLLSFPFWQEDFFAVCHKDAELASLSHIDHTSLENTSLLLLKEGHCLTDHALSVCHMPRPQQDNAFAGTSLFTLVQMVAGKMGATLVPEMALDVLLTGYQELTAMHLDEPGPHREIAFIMRPNYAGMSDIETLMALFKKTLSSFSCTSKS
ncbi:MAG: LysR substrate-binding domain-containing protein [Reinekea sp.]|jgi:LysR family transcriptional regulator, hydrogen peroxide-inducible genes activator